MQGGPIMTPEAMKAAFADYAHALRGADATAHARAAKALMSADAVLHLCHPFGTVEGPVAFSETALGPLRAALPDLERRDMIRVAGTTPEGSHWLGCMGNYMGSFRAPLLGIPPTGRLAHMRYHEFFRFEGGRVVEMQAIWDIPELMMQAGAWPMAPQLGAYLCTPAPMSGDGLQAYGDGQATMDHVLAMLTDLCRHPADPDPAVMQLDRYWHPQCNWYGPAGIGTSRGVAGFRHIHQIPFLRAMPDRKLDASADLHSHWVAQGEYVCETGWPNMRLTLSHDGWMGIAPAGKEVLLRSLDFWRMEDGLIRENWVLVDLLDLYRQVGVDVLGRMGEFNAMRSLAPIPVPDTMQPVERDT